MCPAGGPEEKISWAQRSPGWDSPRERREWGGLSIGRPSLAWEVLETILALTDTTAVSRREGR
jgi:hypothetical protein